MARALCNTFNNTYFDVYDDCTETLEPRVDNGSILSAIVQPNPTKGEVNVILNNSVAGSIEVFDISGKLVYTDKLTGQSQYSMKLDVDNGVYLLNVVSETGERFIKKLVVSK